MVTGLLCIAACHGEAAVEKGPALSQGAVRFETARGPWIVRVFQDEDRNRDWQPAREPASEGVRVELQPAGEVTDLKLELRRRTGAP